MPPSGADDGYYNGRDGYYIYSDDSNNAYYQPYYPGAEAEGAAATPPTATASFSRADLISPARKPVPKVTTSTSAVAASRIEAAAAADQVSPLETRHAGLTRNQSINATLSPQRMGTISSGGRHTVSPASSIHQENDDIDNDNEGGRRPENQQHFLAYVGGGLTPSPPHHQDAAQKGWHAGSQQPQHQHPYGNTDTAPGWTQQQYQDPSVPRTILSGQGLPQNSSEQPRSTQWYLDNNPLAQHPVQPATTAQWPATQLGPTGDGDNVSDDDDIPQPLPQPWRGSRDLEELVAARALAAQPGRGPIRTSYGPNSSPPPPVPPPKSPPRIAAAAAAARRPQGINIRPTIVNIPPLASPPPTAQGQQRPNNHGRTVSAPTVGQRAERVGGRGPFMHYEDLDVFDAGPGDAPGSAGAKDESQIGAVPARADTFPDEIPLDDGLKKKERRRATKQWAREQRKHHKFMRQDAEGGGEGFPKTAANKERKKRGSCGAFLSYCAHWLPELLCWLLSVLCFVAIIAVLKVYDGRGLSDWPLAVSLNTLVAFLTAICQVALAIPLGEGLSQLKWNSFARGEKPMADYQTFEDAKRGPVGSAKLLFRRKGRALGMSAGLAALTSFLLSPLTQAAITYPSRNIAAAGGGTATVARSESYSHPEPYTLLDPLEKQAIQTGLFHPPSLPSIPHIQPTCSTGTCHFSNISSLAICSAVSDISSRLTVTTPTASGSSNASLPNGHYLFSTSSTSPSLNISSSPRNNSFLPSTSSSLSLSMDSGKLSSGIANLFFIYSSTNTFRASEILFHFCVNTYSVSVINGISTSQIVHSSALSSDTLSRRAEDAYTVKREDVAVLNNYLINTFSGSYSGSEQTAGTTPSSEVVGTALFSAASSTLEDTINNITANVATSLTNAIRSSSSSIIKGDSLTPSLHIEILWPFISFLALQIALVTAFLLGIMIQTAVWDVAILKASPLPPLLVLGAQEKSRMEDQDLYLIMNGRSSSSSSSRNAESRGGLKEKIVGEKQFKNTRARFRSGDRGWGLEFVRQS